MASPTLARASRSEGTAALQPIFYMGSSSSNLAALRLAALHRAFH